MLYIDIHTHQQKQAASIINCSGNFSELPKSGFYSAGIHPWYITAETERDWIELTETTKQTNVLAIGECGLDKVCKIDFALQQQYFIQQIQLANNINKPLIIHCVRAYNEVLQILQQFKVQVPVVFHGFNKNKTLAQQLIDKDYYLSFGKHLFTANVAETFKALPLTQVFLETDDSEVEIEDIYKAAASIKNIDIVELTKQLTKNAKHVFGIDFK